ncbi:MAG: sialic acid O-acetyltransferase [Propionivibrio sp.]|uniref:hypothetical protein n=1 Tax=Propionivibrio sp. TaxID=2212460 RepID=UPI0025CCEB0B|nr:hypothetical protein [Propionivibrio sp.]MBK8893851.1 sialic acid O-acetyltransferase [Propionivibrio sp.]
MNSERPVVIIGGKGTAVNIAEQIEDARLRHGNPLRVEGFAIDDPLLGKEIAGLPVVCGVREVWSKFRDSDVGFIFALYRPDVMPQRLALARELQIPIERFENFIHPLAYVSASAVMGRGNVIMSHACLQQGVALGNFNIINSHVVIEHEAALADGCFLAASVCVGARVRIGSAIFVGLNSTLREDLTVADHVVVGMASGLLNSVAEGAVVYGLPARPKR